jgi:hypothetical protein
VKRDASRLRRFEHERVFGFGVIRSPMVRTSRRNTSGI